MLAPGYYWTRNADRERQMPTIMVWNGARWYLCGSSFSIDMEAVVVLSERLTPPGEPEMPRMQGSMAMVQRNPDGSVSLARGITLSAAEVAAIVAACSPGSVARDEATQHLAAHARAGREYVAGDSPQAA